MADPIVKLNQGTGKVRIDQVSPPTTDDMASNKKYTDDRDITAASFNANTLTLTRAEGNLAVTIHSGSSSQAADIDISSALTTVSSSLIHASTFAVFLNGVLMDKSVYTIPAGGGSITFTESLYENDVIATFDNGGDAAGVSGAPTYFDLESENGTRWRVTVTNAGSLDVTEVT